MRNERLNVVPVFEGRQLVRPDEEIVDQGLAFDLATFISRRQMLRALGLGAAGLTLAACTSGGPTEAPSSSTTSGPLSAGSPTATASSISQATGEIPDETAGPFPGDGSNGPDVLTKSGIVRGDLTSSFGGATGIAAGIPMSLQLIITDIAGGGRPFAGVAVYVWHCDQAGRYSLYSDGATDANYLRGVQIADSSGSVRFSSIYPACYSGRWPHIHFEVYPGRADITDATKTIVTSQVALPADACDAVYATPGYESSGANLAQVTLASDNVFGNDAGVSQLATVTGNTTSGYTVSLAVGIDTTTAPTGGGNGPGGGPPGRPPGGTGPGGGP